MIWSLNLKAPSLLSLNNTIGVAYLARGIDINWFLSCERFLESYRRHKPGIKHCLYVIYKGFVLDSELEKAKSLFSIVPHKAVFLDDDSFDIGAYIEWANMIEEELICVFNTASEILAPDWLSKLAINLMLPNAGLVGASASYESLNELNRAFPNFPNIHIRSNAFMMDRGLFCRITEGVKISTKGDAWHIESGPKSLTQQVLAAGKDILLVGRNGRGYSPRFWATSGSFRQGEQQNLLIADNQTRHFGSLTWAERRDVVFHTWGDYVDSIRNPEGYTQIYPRKLS